jgi:hypothetical protein
MAGLIPVDHRGTFTSNRTHEGIRATMMDRDFSRAHLCKLRLPFLAVSRRFLSLPGVIPTELLLIPSEFLAKNGGKTAILAGIGWDHIFPVSDGQAVAMPRVTALL